MQRARTSSERLTRRARQRGFSFIELLVVMGIIGVLVGGVLVAVNYVFEWKPRWKTQDTIARLTVHIEDWENHYEFYPPTSAADLLDTVRWRHGCTGLPNAVNDGNECVNQSLLLPGAPTNPAWSVAEEGNLDGDALPRSVNRLGTTALTETLDGYGRPYVYLHSDDYARHADAGVIYSSHTVGGDAIEVTPRPHRRADGSFANPRSFQLFSMGPDGVPNTEDDIVAWN